MRVLRDGSECPLVCLLDAGNIRVNTEPVAMLVENDFEVNLSLPDNVQSLSGIFLKRSVSEKLGN